MSYYICRLITDVTTPVCTSDEFVRLLRVHRVWEHRHGVKTTINGASVRLQVWEHPSCDEAMTAFLRFRFMAFQNPAQHYELISQQGLQQENVEINNTE